MNKQALRQHIKEQKKRYSQEQLNRWSLQIQRQIEATTLFRKAQTILLYHSLPDEVQTLSMLKDWHPQKQCLLPQIQGDSLVIRKYTGEESLQLGSMGIQEPTGEIYSDYQQIDLVIVPGMAFDRQGGRLGRGRGYYDRLLPAIEAPAVGICFPFQLVEEVPVDSFDVLMHQVIAAQ